MLFQGWRVIDESGRIEGVGPEGERIQVENGPQKVRERLVRAVPTPIAELRFPRRLGEKCLEDLDDVAAPALRAFPLPFLVLLEGEDFLEPMVAFTAFVRICGH